MIINWTVGRLGNKAVFGAAMCKIQARKSYIESLPLVGNIKEAASLMVKCPLPLDRTLALRKYSMLN